MTSFELYVIAYCRFLSSPLEVRGGTKGLCAVSVPPLSARLSSVCNATKTGISVLRASILIKFGGYCGYAKLHILPNSMVTLRSKVTGRGQ